MKSNGSVVAPVPGEHVKQLGEDEIKEMATISKKESTIRNV